MLPELPLSISVLFIITALIAVWLFYKATNYNQLVLTVLAGWLALQTVMAFAGFYERTDTVPPRLAFLIGPPLDPFVRPKNRQSQPIPTKKPLTDAYIKPAALLA